jgi:hypothetical protein
LQIAPTPEFGDGLIERRLDSVVRHGETLPEGDWHWRAASVDETGKLHGWGPPRAFRVQALPNPPVAQARADAGQALFAWSESRGAARYGLEVGDSPDLGMAQVKLETTATHLSVPLESGKYYWRMRAIEEDGQSGAWSAVSPVIVPPDAPSGLAVQVDGDQLRATWKGDAPAYKLELSTDTSFAEPLSSQLVHEAGATLPKPKPGDYWLRVTGVGAEGVEGPASEALAVQVKSSTPWWLMLLPLLMIP